MLAAILAGQADPAILAGQADPAILAGQADPAVLAWHASRALFATVASVVIGVVVAVATTHGARWKVSLHLGGGCVADVVLLFRSSLLVLTPLVALVGWARWRWGAS